MDTRDGNSCAKRTQSKGSGRVGGMKLRFCIVVYQQLCLWIGNETRSVDYGLLQRNRAETWVVKMGRCLGPCKVGGLH